MISPLLEAALFYADLGYPVFPCRSGTKKPITEHGLKDASTDSDQVEEWWTEHPEANVAICTDGMAVIDVDGSDNQWLGDQDNRWKDLTAAPTSRTPRGGTHSVFRAPEGRQYRNSESLLAEKVDVRANGGYIIAPPSVFAGNKYHWVEGLGLEVARQHLPVPPPWLVDALDRVERERGKAKTNSVKAGAITEGRRNATLTGFAGSMRRVGMTATEIVPSLMQINGDRCQPPLDGSEVTGIATSVSRYAPDAVALRRIHEEAERMANSSIQLTPPSSLRSLMARFPRLREPVIHNLLRVGETMNIISLPKIGKSWLVTDLALAITSGSLWLGTFQTEVGDVLIIDNELHAETSAHRIPKVALARGTPIEAVEDRLFVHSLRGELRDLLSMGGYFRSIEPGQFKVIILDAFYRFMPQDMDENDNGTMSSLYNQLDLYANHLECSFVLIHHATKGNQSGKSITDVGAGAGSQSRATDTHLILRPHQEPDVVVLEAAVRSWPPVEPKCLRWQFPIFELANDLDPRQLKRESPSRKAERKDWTAIEFTEAFVNTEHRGRASIISSARDAGLTDNRAKALLREAESKRLIYAHSSGRNRESQFATIPPPETPPGGKDSV